MRAHVLSISLTPSSPHKHLFELLPKWQKSGGRPPFMGSRPPPHTDAWTCAGLSTSAGSPPKATSCPSDSITFCPIRDKKLLHHSAHCVRTGSSRASGLRLVRNNSLSGQEQTSNRRSVLQSRTVTSPGQQYRQPSGPRTRRLQRSGRYQQAGNERGQPQRPAPGQR